MGFTALAIADRVGHESIDITYRYAHLFPTRQAEMATSCRVESYLVAQLDALSGDLLDACQAMSRALEAAPAADAGIDAARYYRDQVASRLEEMRSIIDRMEPLVGADYWPYPTYADILFSV